MKWLARSLVMGSLALAVGMPSAAHAQIDSGLVPLKTAIAEIYSLRVAYADAYNNKDAAALAAMYTADAIWTDEMGHVVKGGDAIKQRLTADAPTFPHMVITPDTLRVFGNTAVDQGTVTMHPAAGGEMIARYLVVLRRDRNGWKLASAVNVSVAK